MKSENNNATSAPIDHKRREDLWEALSDIFNDNEVDYDYIASQVLDIDCEDLERILFEEVAPYCASNLLTTLPPIWTGFSRLALIKGIRAMQVRNSRSVIRKFKHKLLVSFYRRYFQDSWQNLISAMDKAKS